MIAPTTQKPDRVSPSSSSTQLTGRRFFVGKLGYVEASQPMIEEASLRSDPRSPMGYSEAIFRAYAAN